MTTQTIEFRSFVSGDYKVKTFKAKNLSRLAITLWTTSAALMAFDSASAQGSGSIWMEMQPVFRIFQDMAMIVGAIALFAGLLTMVFKKQLGHKVILTAAWVVGGCFLVPAAIMLVSIIGTLINDTLMQVFQNSGLRGSIPVGS